MSKPSQQKSDELVNLPKIISATVKWKKHTQGWRLKAKAVAINGEESFELLAYAGKTNYSFALLYKKYPLRKFTKHSPHKIGGLLFDKPHKHVWNGTTENKIAYIPDDIDPDDDINQQFLSFCEECHIEIVGGYQSATLTTR